MEPTSTYCYHPKSMVYVTVHFWYLSSTGLDKCIMTHQFSSVAQSCVTLCDPMNRRPPCPPPTPGVHPNSCLLSQWYHPAISSSVVPFSCPQSFPTSGSFQWVSCLHHVARALQLQLQHQFFHFLGSKITADGDFSLIQHVVFCDCLRSALTPHLCCSMSVIHSFLLLNNAS